VCGWAAESCAGLLHGCRAGDAGGVVAEGETGLAWRASRETRLMAWAADLFQQLASLRQDLREARLEVVGAKEVSRTAWGRPAAAAKAPACWVANLAALQPRSLNQQRHMPGRTAGGGKSRLAAPHCCGPAARLAAGGG
jgi:hypothetical protein